MSGRTSVMIVAGFLAFGCIGQERRISSGVVVSDSAGITIIDSGVLDSTLVLSGSPHPALKIGVIDGPAEMQFFRVSDVKRLSDGGIAVANAGSRELRIYNPGGTHRATAGGTGQGPSEFRYPSALVVLPGDTIQVQDFLDRVYFSASGDFVRRETMDRGAFAALWSEDGGMSEGGQWMPDGTLFAPVYHWNQNPPVPGPLFRPAMTFVRVSEDLTDVDTLGDFGGILQQYVDVGGERGASATVPPFATNTSWALGAGDGSVVAGDNAAPRFDRFLPDGSHSIIRWTADSRSVSRSEVEEWKDLQRSAEWTQSRLPELERAWASMDVPEAKPYYGRVTAGSDGTVWLADGDGSAEHTSLRAFAADGSYLGRLELPARFTPYDSGPGWVLGVVRDETDIEFLWLVELPANHP